MPSAADAANSAMPTAASTNPPSTIGEPATAACARAIRSRTCPGHEQQQQDVVDRHDRPDGGALVAERARTRSGTNTLSSGPVTPANSPPRPTMAQVA